MKILVLAFILQTNIFAFMASSKVEEFCKQLGKTQWKSMLEKAEVPDFEHEEERCLYHIYGLNLDSYVVHRCYSAAQSWLNYSIQFEKKCHEKKSHCIQAKTFQKDFYSCISIQAGNTFHGNECIADSEGIFKSPFDFLSSCLASSYVHSYDKGVAFENYCNIIPMNRFSNHYQDPEYVKIKTLELWNQLKEIDKLWEILNQKLLLEEYENFVNLKNSIKMIKELLMKISENPENKNAMKLLEWVQNNPFQVNFCSERSLADMKRTLSYEAYDYTEIDRKMRVLIKHVDLYQDYLKKLKVELGQKLNPTELDEVLKKLEFKIEF